MSIEKNNIYSNMLNTYKKDDLHMATVKYENIRKQFGKEEDEMMIQVKIDGELTALVKDKRGARLYSRNGRIRTNTPLTKEAATIPGEFVIIGELYAMSETGGPQTYAISMSMLRKPESIEDEKKFRFSAFDIVEYNDAPYVESYLERFKELKDVLKKNPESHYIHLAPYTVGTYKDMYRVWEEYVSNGWEGLVAHTTTGIYKIKKFFPIDLDVVAVTSNTGHEHQIGALQTAFMIDDQTFVLSSKVGTGLTFEDRVNWMNWALEHEVPGPNKNFIWVDPTKEPRIIEVRVEEFRGKEEMELKFDGKQFIDSGKEQTVTLRKPVFVRMREDKQMDPKELGFDQVPVWDRERGKVVSSSYPKHPDTVIFEANEYYSKDITEKDVYNYYDSVADNIYELIRDHDLMTVTRTDGGDIVRKHTAGDGEINIESREDFNTKINTGRMIELHRIISDMEDFMVIDIDPRRDVPFQDTKKLALELVLFMEKEFPESSAVNAFYSGSRGFHIYTRLPEKVNVNSQHDILENALERWLDQNPDRKISLKLPEHNDETRLDITIYHEDGAIRLPNSLHKDTGLAARYIRKEDILGFNPEMAMINKLTKVSFVIIENDNCKPALGVDFDNTLFLVDGNDYYSGYINIDLVPVIQEAKATGKDIIIFTARIFDHPEDIEFIANVLDTANIPWDEITYEKKPYMEEFIDDRAINVDDVGEGMQSLGLMSPMQFGDVDTIVGGSMGLLKQFKLKTKGNPPSGVSSAQFPRVTKNYLRYRQFSPSLCIKGTYALKKLSNGDKAVMCKRRDTKKMAIQSKMVNRQK